jgi:hypothetical protein
MCAAVALGSAAQCALAAYTPNPVDFATSVVDFNLNNETLAHYSNPASMLGSPTITFNDPFGNTSGDPKKFDNSKIIEPPYQTDHATGADVLTEIPESTATATYFVTVQMGRPVTDNPNNPYGVDFIVYGNSFFIGTGGAFANDTANLHNFTIHNVLEHPLIVSVSPDNVNWYTYPQIAGTLPFQAYQWDDTHLTSTTSLLDFNQPVDPTIAASAMNNGYSTAAQVLNAYGTASGGTGFDLAQSGFSSINYIRVASGTSDYAVIDSIAAVNPVPEPGTFSLIGVGSIMLLRRRR